MNHIGFHPARVAFQGIFGANMDIAARELFPMAETCPCQTFTDAFESLATGGVDAALIAIDNSIAGRVADVHALLPSFPFFIVAEHFMRIRHNLLGVRGATLEDIVEVSSHVHALPQCSRFIRTRHLRAVVAADTAGAARDVAAACDKSRAAIASTLAAELYGLDILARDIEDSPDNTTRFIALARNAYLPSPDAGPSLTALMFSVKNIPAALYKVLGAFATNGLQLAKIESYLDHSFRQARFYLEVEGHQEDLALRQSLSEMSFYTDDLRILGSFPQAPFRYTVIPSKDGVF